MEHDLVYAALRVIFLFTVPLIVAVLFSSIIVTALQTATAISEPVLGYSVRVLTVVVVLYISLPSLYSSLLELFVLAFK
jgi:flagellar biosynthesis protein FliQ